MYTSKKKEVNPAINSSNSPLNMPTRQQLSNKPWDNWKTQTVVKYKNQYAAKKTKNNLKSFAKF